MHNEDTLDTALEGYPVVIRFPMHWGDMDALGHANNIRYFRWFESVRIAYFQRIGLSADRSDHLGPILATTACDFLHPLKFPADLLAGARVPRVGRTSFTMEYAVARAEAPTHLVARGSGVIVLVNYKTMEKVAIPDDMRAAITTTG